jgi:hypothetical protein
MNPHGINHLDVCGRMPYALLMASSPTKSAETERTRYVLDDEAAQRFLSALEHRSPNSERGLRWLIEKPSVLPQA